jgi:hypothetical protein
METLKIERLFVPQLHDYEVWDLEFSVEGGL